jgi:hypothetical protein
MFYYKFRVYYDEVEDFVRDIEILSTDNFESFHNILFSSIGLVGHELASFSICDSKWNRKNDITLIDMCDDNESQVPDYDDADDFSTKTHIPKFVMKDSILKDFITDPHQNIIYEYDYLNPKIFYIELLKTQPASPDVQYPRCTNSVKEMPKQTERLLTDPEGVLPLDDEFVDDSYDFDDGYSDEDLMDFTATDGYDDSF